MMLLNFGHVVVVDDVFVVDGVVDVSFLMGNEGVMDLEMMKKLQNLGNNFLDVKEILVLQHYWSFQYFLPQQLHAQELER